LLDPIADKLLVSAALIALVQVRVVPGWLVVLLVGREFAVSGLRSIAAAEGYTISASELGKTKTVSQVVAISLLLIAIHQPELTPWATGSLYLVVLFSLWSAIAYFLKFWKGVDAGVKHRRRAELLAAERERRHVRIAARRIAMMERRKTKAEARKAKAEKAQGQDFPSQAPREGAAGVLPPST
jgi:CDP-diacylglycerol--glycerol-3-phosphate 3-phosphatidyltransferase